MKKLKPLHPHYAFENLPTVYDEDAVTALELCARTAGKTNECVEAFNEHLDECQQTYDKHLEACKQHSAEQDKDIQDAVDYMKVNLEETTERLFNEAVEAGIIDSIPTQTYDKMTHGTFNVRLLGAKGDGVNDDTNAIQFAVDSASTGSGSTVYFPPGKYRITRPITITHHTRLIGAGKRGSSNNGYSGTHIIGDFDGEAVITTGVTTANVFGMEIRDLRVARADNRSIRYGIYLMNASESYLHNVTVNGGFVTGIYFHGGISQLDNLYICANNIGLALHEAHAVTVSNLNSWINNERAINLTGSCCNVTIRDSWIENSQFGVYMGNEGGALMAYDISILNTSYTVNADENYTEPRFIQTYDSTDNAYCVQGLNVKGCVCKCYVSAFPVWLESNHYTIKANFEDCMFFTHGVISCAIRVVGSFDCVTVKNVHAQNYDGTVYNVIDGGSYMEIKPNTKYIEVNTGYPIKLGSINTPLQSFDAGQFYYKDGLLRITNGASADIIPVQGASVSNSSATTVEELKTAFNNLLSVLRNCKVIK